VRTKYIALLRGINVSGKNKIKMVDLREMCVDLNFHNTMTYIQSGNIVFESEEEKSVNLENAIKARMLTAFGYDVKVMVRRQDYFQNILENNPFFTPQVDIKYLHVTFLNNIPDSVLVENLESTDYGTDEFKVAEDKVYLYFPNGYGRTKLTNNVFERKLKTKATTRNWRTVNKLHEMATEG
jgi:uncharacterized protein (DUF1697 family)